MTTRENKMTTRETLESIYNYIIKNLNKQNASFSTQNLSIERYCDRVTVSIRGTLENIKIEDSGNRYCESIYITFNSLDVIITLINEWQQVKDGILEYNNSFDTKKDIIKNLTSNFNI